MSLQDQLDVFRTQFESGESPFNVPRSIVDTIHRAINELIESGRANRAKKVGDVAPNFALKDPRRACCQFGGSLARGPLVLSWRMVPLLQS